jgi:hypothetical protein
MRHIVARRGIARRHAESDDLADVLVNRTEKPLSRTVWTTGSESDVPYARGHGMAAHGQRRTS